MGHSIKLVWVSNSNPVLGNNNKSRDFWVYRCLVFIRNVQQLFHRVYYKCLTFAYLPLQIKGLWRLQPNPLKWIKKWHMHVLMLYKYFRDIMTNHENRYRAIPARRSKSSSNSAERKTDSYLETDLFFLGFQSAVITALCWLSSSVVDLSTTAVLQLWPVRAEGSRVELSA